ncbi:MAG TPA: MFS transporter [Acidimicrobiales bacterium]|nr:MFS transporter [Acidimicrobiales bacterium]
MASRNRWWLLATVLFGLLSSNVTFTIFNVALVKIAGDLHTTQTTLTWAITGPLLTVGVAAPILGKLGDLYGHRRLYLFGLVGSAVCAALTAGAWNAGSLIGARLFSGLGAACLTASSWSLLFRVFGPAERTKVLGWWSLVGAGGPVIGVAIGGPVVQYLGWRWIFVAQVPLILVALAANYRTLPETEPAKGESLDVGGAVLLAVAVGAFLTALNEGSTGWSRPPVFGAAAVSIAGFAAFALVERRVTTPIFPLEWLSRRNFTLPCLAGLAMNFAYMGGFFMTPLFLERGLHYSIGSAGLLQIARPLLFAISAPAAGYLAARTGERPAAVAGAGLMIVSMVAFANLRPGASVVAIVLALGASGLSSGVSMPPISALVANSADVRHMGSASAALQVANQVGVVAGIQLMETVQASREHVAGVVGSFQEAYLVGAIVALVAVAATLLIRGPAQAKRALVTQGIT